MRRVITYDPQRDYYHLLGIDAYATPDEIRQAYRNAVRAVHPDLHPDRIEWATEQLIRINEAYDVLSEPDLRRQYDHQRWPHISYEAYRPRPDAPGTASKPSGSGSPARQRYRSPFSASGYQPNRPWWEQVQRPPSSRYPFSAPTAETAAPQPYWLVVADWLKAHRLGWLEPPWLTLVGLWRSPYGGLLLFLGVALAVNMVFLAYAFLAPNDDSNLFNGMRVMLYGDDATAGPPVPTATPDSLHLLCGDPNARITQPENNTVVGDTFEVYGVIQQPNLRGYTLAVGYLGTDFARGAVPDVWLPVYALPATANTFINGERLSETPVSLRRQARGFWVLRLQVTLVNGTLLPPCDVIVLRQ